MISTDAEDLSAFELAHLLHFVQFFGTQISSLESPQDELCRVALLTVHLQVLFAFTGKVDLLLSR